MPVRYTKIRDDNVRCAGIVIILVPENNVLLPNWLQTPVTGTRVPILNIIRITGTDFAIVVDMDSISLYTPDLLWIQPYRYVNLT